MRISLALLVGALCVGAFYSAAAQTKTPGRKIYFQNPSFEDTPRASASPNGWGSATAGSTPDILPGAWGLECAAQQGKTCLGLVTREDGTSEDVGQTLPVALYRDSCYAFTIFLAHAQKYVGYNQPVSLRVWGSINGQKTELLSSSPMVGHAEWRKYSFQFVPRQNLRGLIFEAYFAPGVLFHYKGNVLLDNCSPIEQCIRA